MGAKALPDTIILDLQHMYRLGHSARAAALIAFVSIPTAAKYFMIFKAQNISKLNGQELLNLNLPNPKPESTAVLAV